MIVILKKIGRSRSLLPIFFALIMVVPVLNNGVIIESFLINWLLIYETIEYASAVQKLITTIQKTVLQKSDF